MNRINNLISPVLFALICVLMLGGLGCGKKGGTSSASFEQAPPAIKADWDTAVAADKTNDYFTAGTFYSKVMAHESELTSVQLETVEKASQLMVQRMNEAVNQGDPAAKDAIVKLMKSQNGRP